MLEINQEIQIPPLFLKKQVFSPFGFLVCRVLFQFLCFALCGLINKVLLNFYYFAFLEVNPNFELNSFVDNN